MTLKTVPVTGILYNADGSVVAGATVSALLTVLDTDGGVTVPSLVSTTSDINGAFTLRLWPNTRGINGSQYRVRAQMPAALPGALLANLLITVLDGDSATPVAIQSIINLRTAALTDAQVAVNTARDWALVTGGDVPEGVSGDRSSKSWAQENLTPAGGNRGGSAKDWAQGATSPDGVSKSAKSYAQDAAAGPATATHAAFSKATPVDADEIPLVDSAASFALKRLTWANLKAGVFAAWGALVVAAASKVTPVDADSLAIADSASSNATSQLTWANLKATLKTYFDTLYLGTVAPLVLTANLVEQRNGANAQTLRVYNTFTDAANNAGVAIGCVSGAGYLGGLKNGTGGAVGLTVGGQYGTGAAAGFGATTLVGSSLQFTTQTGNVFNINSSGHCSWNIDNSNDVGDATHRPRTIYAGTSVVTPTVQTADSTVSALPAAAAGNRGQRRHVTDATVAASGNFGATVAGGGANVVPVFSTGAAWIIA